MVEGASSVLAALELEAVGVAAEALPDSRPF